MKENEQDRIAAHARSFCKALNSDAPLTADELLDSMTYGATVILAGVTRGRCLQTVLEDFLINLLTNDDFAPDERDNAIVVLTTIRRAFEERRNQKGAQGVR